MGKYWVIPGNVLPIGMGLDAVELVMAFEEEFGIEITDADAAKIFTVGDSVDLVFGRLKEAPLDEEDQGERIVDNRFRSALGKSIHEFPWDEPLITLLGQRELDKHYHELGVPHPKDPPLFAKLRHLFAWIGAIFLGHYVLSELEYSRPTIPIAIGAAVCVGLVIYGLSFFVAKQKREFRPTTIQDLVDRCSTVRVGEISRERVAARVYAIVEEQLDVEPDEIHDDAHFQRDLGLD